MDKLDRDWVDVVEIRAPVGSSLAKQAGYTGYGRDLDEAIAHSGWSLGTEDEFLVDTVTIVNAIDSYEPDSLKICLAICSFHISDQYYAITPSQIKDKILDLIARGLYAEAVWICFTEIWDRDPMD